MQREEEAPYRLVRIATFVLGGASLVCWLALFRSIFLHQAAGIVAGCFIAAAGFLLACLRLRPLAKVNMAISILSIGIGVYALEFGLWYQAFRRPKTRLLESAVKSGSPVDHRTKLEVISDLRRRGIDAYPSPIPPWNPAPGRPLTGLQVDGVETVPLGGVANHTTVLCNETGQFVMYESDEHGFRNLKRKWVPGQVSVAAVGDSFTQGQCVASDRTLASWISKRCPATVNLGMAGAGPLLYLATIREYVTVLRPRVVLWFHCEGNDFADLRLEKSSPLLMRYLDEPDFHQGLMSKQDQVDRALAGVVNNAMRHRATESSARISTSAFEIARLSSLRTLVSRAIGQTIPMPDQAELQLFRRIIGNAKATVDSWGGTLLFVYLPAAQRYFLKPIVGASNDENLRRQVFAAVESAGITAVNIDEAFRRQSDPRTMYFYLGSHFNEDGYRIAAEAVFQKLDIAAPGGCQIEARH